MACSIDARRIARSLKKFGLRVVQKEAEKQQTKDAEVSSEKRSRHLLDTLARALIELVEGRFRNDFLPDRRPYPDEIYTLVGQTYARVWVDCHRHGLVTIVPQGVFYTPRWVALRLVDLVCEQCSDVQEVLDPACGAGSLLLAWLERRRVKAVHGWDVDRSAVELGRAILQSYTRDHGLDVTIGVQVKDLFEVGDRLPSFDAIVMNPPYGTSLSPSAVHFARRCELQGREPDLFALSWSRVLELSEQRPVGVIVPDVIRMQPEYRRLRIELGRRCSILRIEQLPFGTFPGVTVQPDLVVLGRSDGQKEQVAVSVYPRPAFIQELRDIRRDPEQRWTLDDPRLEELWERCVDRSLRLADVARCHEGVHTGNIRSKLLTEDPRGPWTRRLLKGSDIQPFGYTFQGRYIRYNKELIDRRSGDYASLRDPALFEGPKLLSRQTSDRLIVCLDRDDHVSDNTLHCIKLEESSGLELEWLAILLNSNLATVLYRFQSGEQLRPLPQIKLALLRRLPVRPPAADSRTIRGLVRIAQEEARKGRLSENTIAQTNRLVFDCFCIFDPEREWIRSLVS